jgi:hypothetical protein
MCERDIVVRRQAPSEKVALKDPSRQGLEDGYRIVASINRFVLELYSSPEILNDIASKYLKKDKHFPEGNFVLGARWGHEYGDPFRCHDMNSRYSFMLGFEQKVQEKEGNEIVWLSVIGIDSFKSSTKQCAFESWHAMQEYEKEYKKLEDFPLITRIQGVNPREYGGRIMDNPEQRLRSEIMSSFRWEAVMVDVVKEWSKEAGFPALYLQPGEKNSAYLYNRMLSLKDAKRRYDGIARRCHFRMADNGYYVSPIATCG